MTGDSRSSSPVSRSDEVFAEVCTDEEGRLLFAEPYHFKRLNGPGEHFVRDSKSYTVVSSTLHHGLIVRTVVKSARSETRQTESTEARSEPARSSVSNAGGAHGYGRAADTGTPPIEAENVGAGGSPAIAQGGDKNSAPLPIEVILGKFAVDALQENFETIRLWAKEEKIEMYNGVPIVRLGFVPSAIALPQEPPQRVCDLLIGIDIEDDEDVRGFWQALRRELSTTDGGTEG